MEVGDLSLASRGWILDESNDAAAKREVTDGLCEWFDWKAGNIIDLATPVTRAARKCFACGFGGC
jgi:hypothetical protein